LCVLIVATLSMGRGLKNGRIKRKANPMTKNDFASRIQRRWQDRVVNEAAERTRLAEELAYQLAQYKPRYIKIGLWPDEDVSLAEADSEGRIEYE